MNDATALVVTEAALTIPRHIPKELVLSGEFAIFNPFANHHAKDSSEVIMSCI